MTKRERVMAACAAHRSTTCREPLASQFCHRELGGHVHRRDAPAGRRFDWDF